MDKYKHFICIFDIVFLQIGALHKGSVKEN